jgi:hypothetical protein
VQLRLAEQAAQAEEQPVVVGARVEDGLGVGQERAAHGRQVEQRVPGGVAAGQAAGLEGQDEADLVERDGADQLLEARALAILTGLPLVVVDEMDALARPAQGERALDERVLVLSPGDVLLDLLGRRLADIDVGPPLAVTSGDLVSAAHRHHRPPPG